MTVALAAFGAEPQEVELPDRAAAPETNPRADVVEPAPPADEDAPARSDIPVPEPRPVPEPAPEEAEPAPPAPEPEQETEAPAPAAPRASETPDRHETAGALVPPGEMACRARLSALGASFEVRPAEGDESGCALPFPVSVSSLSRGIALEPAALVNCATAEAAARFVQDVVAPEAERRFGSELETVRQLSGYVCRPRNGTHTLSEHAFGNALDFGAFVLADGRTIDVRASSDPKTRGFLRHVRSAACGPFTTVLGPGTDADHANHFHLDLAERRNGAYCR